MYDTMAAPACLISQRNLSSRAVLDWTMYAPGSPEEVSDCGMFKLSKEAAVSKRAFSRRIALLLCASWLTVWLVLFRRYLKRSSGFAPATGSGGVGEEGWLRSWKAC